MSFWRYAPYVSVAQKKAKALKKLAQLQKKNPGLRPIQLEGRAIARTWWGKSWINNLECYADYHNRIGRGRCYVRNCAVLDLQIKPGEVQALVQGSVSKPYSISIKIRKMALNNWQFLKKECQGKLDSLQELLLRRFPKALAEVFTVKKTGLFPAPAEITFSCSCPDWASMCKHVAAALYGVGCRLDEDPALFFTLRKVDMSGLISQAIDNKAQELLKKAEKKSKRVLVNANLAEMFGIDIEEKRISPFSKPPLINKNKSRKVSSPKQSQKPVKATKITGKSKVKKELSELELLEQTINKSRKGLRSAELISKTGLTAQKIYGLIGKLKRQGKVKNATRGIYCRVD